MADHVPLRWTIGPHVATGKQPEKGAADGVVRDQIVSALKAQSRIRSGGRDFVPPEDAPISRKTQPARSRAALKAILGDEKRISEYANPASIVPPRRDLHNSTVFSGEKNARSPPLKELAVTCLTEVSSTSSISTEKPGYIVIFTSRFRKVCHPLAEPANRTDYR